MPSRNRGTISLSAKTHARLQAYCDANSITMASLVTQLLEPVLAETKLPDHEDLLDVEPAVAP